MSSFNLYSSQLEYIKSMIDRVTGLKVLLLDDETAGIISLVYSHSQILEKEIFLIERLNSSSREAVRHLKAVCFIRPTSYNFTKINEELKHPLYSEYHLFFTNIVPPNELEDMARHDDFELVQEVQEFFADIYVLNYNLFSLNIESVAGLMNESTIWSAYEKGNFNRMLDGIFATLCTLRVKPIIRYQKMSTVCSQLARKLSMKLNDEQQLFEGPINMPYNMNSSASSDDFYGPKVFKEAVLLIIDRRDDPITPLLNQWTYQAMLHELIGIENNRVNIKIIPGINDSTKQIVMSPFLDSFYEQNHLAHFGQLGISIKQLLDNYQQQKKTTSKIESLEDIQKFLEIYPDYQKMSGNVSKHVETVHILNKIISSHNLMEVSLLEQEIACHSNMQEHFKLLMEKLELNTTAHFEQLRLALLYALRYEGDSTIDQLKMKMAQKGFEKNQIKLIDALLEYAGSARRTSDLFQNKNLLTIAKNTLQRTLQGTSNILTQHQSVLTNILELIFKGKLKEQSYPVLHNSYTPSNIAKEKPTNIIVFMVGGATYEEAKDASLFASTNNCNVILGGTTIHNTKSFLADVAQIIKAPLSEDFS